MVAPLSAVNEGRFGEDMVGLMDEGGVMESYEEVSIVEDDLAVTISTS